MIHFSVQRLIGLCALALASLLAGCGGSSSTVNPLVATRVIAFGDAFSDVGNSASTYYDGSTNAGKRFTIRGTTTGNTLSTPTTIAEVIANFYGLWSTDSGTKAPVAMSATVPYSGTYPTTGLVSYAVGNSMINPAGAYDGLGGTDASLSLQVKRFLADDRPRENDLIVITAGTRDLLAIAYRYFSNVTPTKVSDGSPLTIDATLLSRLGGGLTYGGVFTELDNTTTKLVNNIEKLVNAGAKHIVVVEPMILSRTPWGLSLDSTATNFLRSLSYDTSETCLKTRTDNSLHCKLTVALDSIYHSTVYDRKVLQVDWAQYINNISGTVATGGADTYKTNGGFSQLPTTPACSVMESTTPVVNTSYDKTSLVNTKGCDASSSVWSDTSYTNFLFADNLNLTPQGNLLLGNLIYSSKMYLGVWR